MSRNPFRAPQSSGVDYGASHVRWLIFGLACATSFLTYIHRYSWGVVKPYVRSEYGLSDTDLGWLDGLFTLTYALGQFFGGWLGDALGPRLILPLAAVAWSVLMVGPALFVTFWQLVVVRMIFGAAQAPSYPNLGKITANWFPLSIRTTVQGAIASLSGRVGGAMAPIVISTLLIGFCGFGWRASLYILASFGFAFAVVFYLLFRNRPSEHPWVNDAERRVIEAGDDEAASASTTKYRFHLSGRNLLNLTFFASASFCSTFADNVFVYWMPQFMSERGFDAVESGLFASLPLWGGALGGLTGGFLNDALMRKLGSRRWARRMVAGVGKTVAAVLIAVSLLSQDGRMVMVILACCKFFSDFTQPTWWGTVTDLGGPAAGRVFGLVNLFGALGGFVAGPMMGHVLEQYGWTPLFLFVGGVYLVTAACWQFVDCTRRLVVPA